MGNRRVPPFVSKWGKDGESGKLADWAKDKYGLALDYADDSMALVKKIQDHKAAQPDTPPVEERKAAKTDFDPEVMAGAAALPALHAVPPLPLLPEFPDKVTVGPSQGEPAPALAHVQSEGDPVPAPVPSEVPPDHSEALLNDRAHLHQAPQVEAPGEVANRKARAAKPRPDLPKPKDPSKPLDPYQAVGLEAGGRKKEGLFFLPDGTPLKPDTNPVLSEEDADVATNNHNIDDRTGQPFKDLNETTIGADDFNGSQRHTNFRHPQGTKLLLNPRTGVAFRPTELLMRKEGFTPHFSADMPKGYVFGG